jgi:hypothetical protein
MITLKNISAVVAAPFLSVIFLALPAQAFLTTSDDKTQNISGQVQEKNQSTPVVHHEHPREHQQTTSHLPVGQQPTLQQLQPPILQQRQPIQNRQETRNQSSTKTQGTQNMHQDRSKNRDNDHDRDHDSNRVIIVPNNNFIGNPYPIPDQNYNYGNYIPQEYSEGVPSPGAFVNSLPGYTLVIVNGITYAVYEDVFYKPLMSGYVVVDPYRLISGGSFSISIPNSWGKYTQIQIKVVDNGFIGPQGEFYSHFPSIRELTSIYVR